jgi:hypothetical protein
MAVVSDIPSAPSLPGLTALTTPEVKGLWYKDKEICIDGWRFVSCRFDNCTLTLETTEFAFTNCLIDSSCTIRFRGKILNVLQLFNRDYEWMRTNNPIFAAVKNPDGTITIGV